jgi:hypothetical protein
MEEKMKKEKVLYVKVDKEMHEKMKEVAKQKGVRMTDIIRILLSHFLSGKIEIEDEFFSIRSERFKKLNCSYCGKEFWKYITTIHSRQKIFFCSRECYLKYKEKNHRVVKNCAVCGKEFTILLSDYKARMKRRSERIKNEWFCSKECFGKWIGKNRAKGKKEGSAEMEKI